MNTAVRSGLMMLAMLVGRGACAHHSLAMFDQTKTLTLEGTVYKFEWNNPHVWLWISVPGAPDPQLWGLESGAPPQLKRDGLTWDSFKPGEAITVTLHPTRDGAHSGHLLSAVAPNGPRYQSHEPPPPADSTGAP